MYVRQLQCEVPFDFDLLSTFGLPFSFSPKVRYWSCYCLSPLDDSAIASRKRLAWCLATLCVRKHLFVRFILSPSPLDVNYLRTVWAFSLPYTDRLRNQNPYPTCTFTPSYWSTWTSSSLSAIRARALVSSCSLSFLVCFEKRSRWGVVK